MLVSNFPSPMRIGVSGTGFIAQGFFRVLQIQKEYILSKVLTRSKHLNRFEPFLNFLTDSIDDFIENSDLIIECSGDVIHATNVVHGAMQRQKPVVTMNAEFQVTVGSYFCDKGLLTEAEGDQPGSLAALIEEARVMGFNPIVYGNIKGFLNHTPSEEEMKYWSDYNKISLSQVTSFTDGTKLQIEQALIANGFGASIIQKGLLGPTSHSFEEAALLFGQFAKNKNCIISDYILNPSLPAGVFLVAEHPFEKPDVLRYFKLGKGPFYTLIKPYHLCHLEIMKTVHRMTKTQKTLLTNSTTPRINVAAIAKCDIPVNTILKQPIGGFLTRGEAVLISEEPNAVPIGLLKNARVLNSIDKNQTLTWDDVEIPESFACTIAKQIYKII